MSTCVVPGCQGHLGKFSNCLSQALWYLGEDYADESGGNSGAHGFHMLFLIDHNTWMSDFGDGDTFHSLDVPDFQIAGETYVILTESESGMVYMTGYGSRTEAQGTYDDHMCEYERWSEVNEY